MNKSQEILRELSNDPKGSIDFLKRLSRILGMLEREKFLIIVAFLSGILTASLIFNWIG